MNEHNIKMLKSILDKCNDFKNKKNTLEDLQEFVSTINSNFENDIPKAIQQATFNFIEELEYIRLMRDENEQYSCVLNEIGKLELIFDLN